MARGVALFLLESAVGAPNYFHYLKTGDEANYDSVAAVADGVSVFKWNGTEAGVADMQADVCAHNVIEWEAGSPTVYPATDVWNAYDAVYFVAQGNVSISVQGETKTLRTGDTLWVQAGVAHSGFTPVDNRQGVVLDALKTPFEPKSVVEAGPPVTNSSQSYRFYMASEELTPPDVTKIHGPNEHYEWYGSNSDPDVLHVWWKPSALMPCHSHHEGALYVPAWGAMCFEGESERSGSCLSAGEARWTKPDYEYSNEAAGAAGSEIVVMNIHTGPAMCRAVV